MADELQVKKVTIDIEFADGSKTHEVYYYRNETLTVLREQKNGFPQAQWGEIAYILPRWPATRSFTPSPEKNINAH